MREVPPRAIMAQRQTRLLETPKKGAFVSVELRMLVLSVVLGILQIVAASHAASLRCSYRWTSSPRDEQAEPLRGAAGRLETEPCATSLKPSPCSLLSSWWRS